jgi:dihydrodipicolinate synthase/N-acetylneuraminate lyase
MSETLTDQERDILANTISKALSGTISINLSEVPALMRAAKKVGTSKAHVVQGIATWLRTDPQAQDLVLQAAAQAGAAFFKDQPANG